MTPRAEIAVIGGTGFTELFGPGDAVEVSVETPWGAPSAPIRVGTVAGRAVAFLPRHGRGHTVPPHRINYRANLQALADLGVTRVIGPCAVGSLRPDVDPGDVVICDQFIDRTRGMRADTYFDGPAVAHLSAAHPYCAQLAGPAAEACRGAGLRVHPTGTVVVIEGPRFSTVAESRLHAATGAAVINMTQYPEVVLARELGLCYTALALVTDRDSGVENRPDVVPVTQAEVLAVFRQNVGALRDAVAALVSVVPADRTCACAAGRPEGIA